MTNQEIIDLAAQFDLITFGPQDLVYFAREIEARTIARCIKACEDWDSDSADPRDMADAIRALGDNDE